MRGKFLVPFIVPHPWIEERSRIGSVKHHWQAQPAAFIEDRCKALIVNAQQFAVGVAQCEAEILPELDPAGAMLHRGDECDPS